MLVYVDTSVFGGVFDPEFERASKAFFDRVRDGVLEVAISALVLDELEWAPAQVRALFEELDPLLVRVATDDAMYDLRRAYLDAQEMAFDDEEKEL